MNSSPSCCDTFTCPGGWGKTSTKKGSKKKRLPFKQIAPRTYVPLEGDERGIEHFFFNKRILRKEFNDFKICSLKVKKGPKAWEAYYQLLGKLKYS